MSQVNSLIPVIGQKAPSINLPDQTGAMVDLASFLGNWVLIYFYPKDDTPGCTKEACGIRDTFPAFQKMKITVLGISIDPVKSHKKFVEKFQLPFLLLADEEKKVVEAYGVWGLKKMMGHEYMGIRRTSFLIDPKGAIAKIYENVKPEKHAEEVLSDVESLKT